MASLLHLACAAMAAASLSFAQTAATPLDKLQMPSSPAGSIPDNLTPEKRGDLMMVKKMFREAIESYREAPANSAVVQNKIGIASHQLAQLDVAKRHYERAIKLDPKYAEALNNLGTVFYAKKNYKKAASQYQKALKLMPNSAAIYSNLGTALFGRKKYKEAFEAYQRALTLDPDVFEHRSSYGVMLEDRSVEERAKYHFYLAKVYGKAGVHDRALQYLRMAIEEGYKDRNKLMEEPDFAGLREMPEFQELLKLEPRVL